jgi:hypothetical protein
VSLLYNLTVVTRSDLRYLVDDTFEEAAHDTSLSFDIFVALQGPVERVCPLTRRYAGIAPTFSSFFLATDNQQSGLSNASDIEISEFPHSLNPPVLRNLLPFRLDIRSYATSPASHAFPLLHKTLQVNDPRDADRWEQHADGENGIDGR